MPWRCMPLCVLARSSAHARLARVSFKAWRPTPALAAGRMVALCLLQHARAGTWSGQQHVSCCGRQHSRGGAPRPCAHTHWCLSSACTRHVAPACNGLINRLGVGADLLQRRAVCTTVLLREPPLCILSVSFQFHFVFAMPLTARGLHTRQGCNCRSCACICMCAVLSRQPVGLQQHPRNAVHYAACRMLACAHMHTVEFLASGHNAACSSPTAHTTPLRPPSTCACLQVLPVTHTHPQGYSLYQPATCSRYTRLGSSAAGVNPACCMLSPC